MIYPGQSVQSAVDVAIRQITRDKAKCLACDRRPEKITSVMQEAEDSFLVMVRCHGSKDRFAVSMEDVEDRRLGKLLDWLSGLFPLDGYPDMKELLKYNREPWLTA